MKNGWQTRNLGELCRIRTGKKDVNQGNPDGEFPFFTCAAEHTFSDSYSFDAEALLIAGNGDVGNVSYYQGKFEAYQRTYVLTDFAEVLPRFLFLILDGKLKETVSKQKLGNTMPYIKVGMLTDFQLPVPPLAEQQRIVGVLDEAFAGLATAQANAEKNLQNARALFASHLQSVFTQRSKDWVEKSVAELVNEGTLVKPFDGNHGEIHPKKSDYTESGVPFIMARDLIDGSVDTVGCTFISKKLADSLRVGFAKNGDVLISHKGTIGRSAIVSTKDDYIMLTPQVTSYRVKNSGRLSNRFIRYFFMSPSFQREMIAGAADGSTRAYIGITKQLTLRFRFPSVDEQHKISEKLDALTPKTQRLESLYEQKLEALAALKKSLLHQAFSGNL